MAFKALAFKVLAFNLPVSLHLTAFATGGSEDDEDISLHSKEANEDMPGSGGGLNGATEEDRGMVPSMGSSEDCTIVGLLTGER